MKILTTGFLQVYFVVINTYFISKDYYLGVFICSFVISLIWSFNVKKISIGSLKERVLYSFGASIGGLTGLITGNYLH